MLYQPKLPLAWSTYRWSTTSDQEEEKKAEENFILGRAAYVSCVNLSLLQKWLGRIKQSEEEHKVQSLVLGGL